MTEPASRAEQPRRYRNLRGDTTIESAERTIERTFGLPDGPSSVTGVLRRDPPLLAGDGTVGGAGLA